MIAPAATPSKPALHRRLPPAAAGHLAMLAFSVLVAGSFSLGAMMARDIDPLALTTARFFLAMIVIGALAAATGHLDRRVARQPWRHLILGGLFALYFVLMFEALKTASAVSTSAIFTLTPLLAAGFGWLILRQVATRRILTALAVGAFGALWVIFRGDPRLAMEFRVGEGEAIYLLGSLFHALYIPLVSRLNRGESALAGTFAMLIGGTLVLAVLGGRSVLATDWSALAPLVWITLAYLTLASGAGTFLLLQFASMRLTASRVMAYTYLTPCWVIVWELALGNGAPPLIVLGGIGLCCVALYMLLRSDPAVRDGAAPPSG